MTCLGTHSKISLMEINFWLLGLLIWNLILSFFVYRIWISFNRLTKGIDQGNLEKILKSFFKQEQLTEGLIKDLKTKIGQLEKEGHFYFRKAGLVKFNPFSDLGGDQSFSLALLTDNDEGLVITGLHGRNTTRVYTKLVTPEAKEKRFSKEELRAIKKAKGGKI